MKTNAAGVAIIKRFETLQLKAYKCPAGVWTIGYGHTGDVRPGLAISEHQADAILDVDLDKFERGVATALEGVPVTENQFSALVSFAFNVGLAALNRSTLLRKLKAGDAPGAARAFDSWVYAKGKRLGGLIRRRAAERALFETPDEAREQLPAPPPASIAPPASAAVAVFPQSTSEES